MTQNPEAQSAYDYEREMRRRAKIKAQHEAYEKAYAECLQEVETQPWFFRKTRAEQERYLTSRAAEKFLQATCARGR